MDRVAGLKAKAKNCSKSMVLSTKSYFMNLRVQHAVANRCFSAVWLRGDISKRCKCIITINVPLFKKLRDIIFFWWDNHFMSHLEGHFEGAKTFLTP